MIDRFEIFSKNLKHERQLKGYSQKTVAELINVSQAVYNRYEKGGTPQGREPDFNTLCELAKIFGVSTDYLLGLEE